jgi:hypothetical protein
MEQQASPKAADLRQAINDLITAKLFDVMQPGGLDRLRAHKNSGVASPMVRQSQAKLEEVLEAFEKVRKPRRRTVSFRGQTVEMPQEAAA